MSLSVSNKNHLSKQEELVLANARSNFQREIIAIDKEAPGKPKIVSLSRSEINLWQLFLKLFNAGNLAKYHIHYDSVANHLNQFKWSAAVTENQNSDLYQAYLSVCAFANKGFASNHGDMLFQNVSTEVVDKKIGYLVYREQTKTLDLEIHRSIRWNPLLQIKHVKKQAFEEMDSYKVEIKNAHNVVPSMDSPVTLEELKNLRITVTQYEKEPTPANPKPKVKHSTQHK